MARSIPYKALEDQDAVIIPSSVCARRHGCGCNERTVANMPRCSGCAAATLWAEGARIVSSSAPFDDGRCPPVASSLDVKLRRDRSNAGCSAVAGVSRSLNASTSAGYAALPARPFRCGCRRHGLGSAVSTPRCRCSSMTSGSLVALGLGFFSRRCRVVVGPSRRWRIARPQEAHVGAWPAGLITVAPFAFPCGSSFWLPVETSSSVDARAQCGRAGGRRQELFPHAVAVGQLTSRRCRSPAAARRRHRVRVTLRAFFVDVRCHLIAAALFALVAIPTAARSKLEEQLLAQLRAGVSCIRTLRRCG